jgi:predicted DNA-binding protein (MmcQ/YjbR family)
MNAEDIRFYCLSKREVSEGFPFDNETLVFKVNEKMFALLSLDGPLKVNLKCDPEVAIDLRDKYPAVVPGYHMNKKLWNTVYLDGSVTDDLLQQWIDTSYRLVVEKMPAKDRNRLLGNGG